MMDNDANGTAGGGIAGGMPGYTGERGPGRDRSRRLAWAALSVGTGGLVWSVNALAARSGLRDPATLHAFFGNLQILAVAVTSAVAASVAWTCGRPGLERGRAPIWALALLSSLIGLGCGLAVSWWLVMPVAAGPTRAVFVGAIRLAGVIGAGFALAGAVVSDLSVGLARKAAHGGAHTAGLLHGAAIVVLTFLWAAAGIIAAALARAQVCRP